MAKYTIEDTTLKAYGDAVRRFTSPTRIEEWDQFEWEFELQLHGGASSHGYDGWQPVRSDIQAMGTDLQNRYIRLKYPEQNYYKFMYMIGSSSPIAWDPAIEPELRLPTNTSCHITRADTIDEPCALIIRYTDSKDEPMGKHFSQEVPNTLTPGQMVEVLNNFDLNATIPESALIITGDCQYKFAQGGWDWFLNQMGDKITTKDISNTGNMFYYSKVSEIPFDINLTVITNTYTRHNLVNMFAYAKQLQVIPMIYNALPSDISGIFKNCESLTTFPEGFAEDWNWSYFDSATSSYTGNMSQMFYYCMKLRKIPKIFFLHGNPYSTYSYATTYSGFNFCYSLEELEDVFIPYKGSFSGTYSNVFSNMITQCWRLKKLTLMTQEDGTPYTVNWKDQIIDLTTAGFCSAPHNMARDTDFTNDTKIDTVEKWHGYIDGSYPDGWAASVEYSTFGATAVKELIATLPTASGTNTVKLKQAAASAIPGEEMTSLTEEDIAVATEKGWTITFA